MVIVKHLSEDVLLVDSTTTIPVAASHERCFTELTTHSTECCAGSILGSGVVQTEFPQELGIDESLLTWDEDE